MIFSTIESTGKFVEGLFNILLFTIVLDLVWRFFEGGNEKDR